MTTKAERLAERHALMQKAVRMRAAGPSPRAGDMERLGRRLLDISLLILSHPELETDTELMSQLDELVKHAMIIEALVGWIDVQDPATGQLPEVTPPNPSERQRGQFVANGGSFTYVAFDGHRNVLYIGVTDDVFGRMTSHRQSSPWWPLMVRLTWEEWPDRATAERQELRLIRRYQPPYNTAGNPGGFRGRRW